MRRSLPPGFILNLHSASADAFQTADADRPLPSPELGELHRLVYCVERDEAAAIATFGHLAVYPPELVLRGQLAGIAVERFAVVGPAARASASEQGGSLGTCPGALAEVRTFSSSLPWTTSFAVF